MKGTLHIIYPDKPVEVRIVSAPVQFDELQRIVGGSINVVPDWNHHLDFGGTMVPCITLANEEGYALKLPFNLTATALWQYISTATGNRHAGRLTGPVVVCMGDTEFLENVLD